MNAIAGPYMLDGLLWNAEGNVLPWMAQRIPGMEGLSFSPSARGFGVIRDGHLVGGVAYDWFFDHPDGGDIQASCVMEQGARVTRRMWRHLYGYAFVQLGCIRITCQTGKSNHVTRHHLKRAGFQLEGKRRCGHGKNDVMMYGLLKSECRFL